MIRLELHGPREMRVRFCIAVLQKMQTTQALFGLGRLRIDHARMHEIAFGFRVTLLFHQQRGEREQCTHMAAVDRQCRAQCLLRGLPLPHILVQQTTMYAMRRLAWLQCRQCQVVRERRLMFALGSQ